MSEDFYKNDNNSRDGYKSQNGNSYGSNHYGSERPSRPRFSRGATPVNSNYSQRGASSYRPRYNGGDDSRSYNNYNSYNNEGGYQRPSQGGYRSRYNSNDGEGVYQQRSEGGYQQRGGNRWGKSRYGQQTERGGYQQRQGGYRSRYEQSDNNNSYGTEGGYKSYGSSQQRGGYRQNGGGYKLRFQGGNSSFGGGRRGAYDAHAKYSQKKRLEYKEENYDPTVPMRLNKFLANAGVCSRRDADKYIEAGVVSVNGTVVTELGTKVLRTDEVKFHDNLVKIEKKVYVLLNKPKGYVTTSDDPQNRKTVMDLVRNACPERIYPVGRLDRNTTGVLLLTNDGELASKLTHPKFLKKKIYHVTTDQNVSAADIRQIAEGVTLEDGEIKADAVEYASETDKKQVGIEIHSGKNRIVRRIFESLGYHVIKLDRVYFAGLTKKNVRRGDWRYLTEKEVQMLRMGAFE